MKKQFFEDRRAEIERLSPSVKDTILTEEKLSVLPKAIQRHFRLSGFVGSPIAMNADVIWQESFIKLKPNQAWKPLTTLQFNSVNPIMRTSLMKVNTMLFTGKDLYKEGKGTMIGKILNLFTVIDTKGKELSQSALITSFCEMMLLSGYAFQDYIQWQEIDEHTVKGILTDYDFEVSGTFHFDAEGKFEYFKTDERYFDTSNGKFEKKTFFARVNSYQKSDNYYQPKDVSVSWLLDNQEYEYFKGKINRVDYNVVYYQEKF